MGQELGEVFFQLEQDVSALFCQWNEFVTAFGTNNERIELLNRAASGFARSYQDALLHDVLVGLSRITDNPKTMGKDNLAITRLPDLLEGDIKLEVEELVRVAKSSAEFARDWRNRRIAHRDLEHALDSRAAPLQAASRRLVSSALSSVVAVMHKIEQHFEDSTTYYEEIENLNGVLHLLYIIDDGLTLEQARKERRKAGKTLPEDVSKKTL